MSVTLAPLGKNELSRVAHLRVTADQSRFSGTVAEAFATDEPNVDFHSICLDDDIIGFFKIDRTYFERYYFADQTSLGLRAFLIDLSHQGHKYGSAACRALPDYLNKHYKTATKLYLTVNAINPAGIRSYQRGDFEDTGLIWPYGVAGPQHVFQLHLAK